MYDLEQFYGTKVSFYKGTDSYKSYKLVQTPNFSFWLMPQCSLSSLFVYVLSKVLCREADIHKILRRAAKDPPWNAFTCGCLLSESSLHNNAAGKLQTQLNYCSPYHPHICHHSHLAIHIQPFHLPQLGYFYLTKFVTSPLLDIEEQKLEQIE